MTTVESGPDQTVDSVLDRIGRAVDIHELERAWAEGLRCHRDRGDRDRILAGAATRLRVFGAAAGESLRRTWLRDVAEEVRLRGDQPLGEPLAAVAMAEMREAFAHAGGDLAELRAAVDAGHEMHSFAGRSPAAATRIRDLGRMTERLRGSGVMALVARDDAELARHLAAAVAFRNQLVATVPESMRVSRDALLGWEAAVRELPRLVRSLIAETEPSAEWIDMPAGTAVTQSGWDGVVSCAGGNRFVPAGRSMWELSAKKDGSDGKARSDYDVRVARTPREERTDMAYVAVSCAPWTKGRAFEQEKSLTGEFRLVKALNVDGLEAWLECAPVTTVWLREQMDKPVTGLCLLSNWWAKWLDATTMPLDAGVVLAGRDRQAGILRDRCRQPRGGVITIGGNVHRDELLAFIAAALVPSGSSGSSPADPLYVDDRAAAQRLLAVEALSKSGRPSPHAPAMTVVVPSAAFAEDLPAGSRHLMIVPVPGSSQVDVIVEAVDSAGVAQAMQAAGLDRRTAQELGGLARMSLLALRRHLVVDPALHRPVWATGSVGETLRRSLLLSGWNESREGDRQIVERFVGHPYEAATEALSHLDSGDAPMISTGELWHCVSPADTWMLLREQLSRRDITAFGEVAHEVLTEPDPLWELTGNELLHAQVEGVRARYSSQLKQGVATTLALLGSKPPVLRGDTVPASDAAPGIVWKVLRSAESATTPKTWAAVSETLPLLAEAAPETVLEGLRTCLSEPHALAGAMFTDGGSDEFDFLPSSPHFRIQEALEVLAWSPDHLMAVVDVLAGLAEVDPGGRYSNRPAGSLASIVCPWKPYTSASADDRLTAIRMLRRSRGRVAWPLMLSMLPRSHSTQMPESRPRYRGWKQAEPVVTQGEYAQMVISMAEMLLEDVGEDPDRWADLVEHVAGLPEEIRSRAITGLGRVADAGPDEAFKSTLWPKLQALVTRHRQFSDAHWALPESELASFDRLLELLRPAEAAISYGDLFSSSLMFVDGVRATDGWDEFHEALGTRQTKAVEAIMGDAGVEAVLEFAESVDQPRRVGIALARSDSTLDINILEAMDAAPEAVTQVALGYFGRRFAAFGWEGVGKLLADPDLSSRVAADLLRAPPPVELPWTRVDALGTEVATEYWARVSYYDIGIPEELSQLLEVSRRLREAGRIELARMLLAVRSATHAPHPEFAEEAAACLEQWIQDPPSEPDRSGKAGWELTTLIKVLDRHRANLDTGRVAGIEWQYYPILHHDPDFSAPNLYRELARDPYLFAWLNELAYKPSSASPGDRPLQSQAQRLMAVNAIDVLHSWPASHFAPGLDDEGRVDEESLNEWVDRAREHLAEIDRADIGDTIIGTALAASPPDPNGEWPGVAVRALLERLRNDDVDSGLSIAVRNRRGVTSRSPTTGGVQERDLAESYSNQGRRFKEWPRTAAIFAGLARRYEHEAAIHDREAEARRRGQPL